MAVEASTIQTHGNTTIKDYNYYLEAGKLPEDYHVWWGFEDRKLYTFAREELNQLSESGEPFFLTMLTVDTHMTNGYVCELCRDEYDEQYFNVLACASRQVVDFLDWIKTQELYHDTTVVIAGDHLYMVGDLFPEAIQQNQRRVFTTIVNSALGPLPNTGRDYTTMDMFPTIIDSLGIEYSEPGLGLGRSLYKHGPTLTEQMGMESLNNELSRRSQRYNSFFEPQDK